MQMVLVGGIPIPFNNKKRNKNNFNIEMVETKDSQSKKETGEEKK